MPVQWSAEPTKLPQSVLSTVEFITSRIRASKEVLLRYAGFTCEPSRLPTTLLNGTEWTLHGRNL